MMDDVLSIRTKTQPDRTVRWSDDERDTAFEVWLLEAGRDLRTSEKILASDSYQLPIPYATLWEWRRQHNWDIEGDRRLASVAPNIRQRTAGNLIVSALGMSAYLAQVASGAVQPDKTMVSAAKIALDAAGFSPVGSNKPTLDPHSLSPGDALDSTTDSLDSTGRPLSPSQLTRDQLIERERQRRLARTRTD